MYTPEEKEMMMKTARFTGAIGTSAILPRLVRKMTDQFGTILDYGSGSKAIHTEMLREEGYDVLAYDINPEKSQWHIPDDNAHDGNFDIVFASNVINIQPTSDAVRYVLEDVKRFLTYNGQALFNYPASPRKSGLTVADIDDILNEHFPYYVERITGIEGWVIHTPVWKCKKDY